MARLRRYRLAAVAALVIVLASLGVARAATAPPQDVAVVSVSPGTGGQLIQPGFLGLSLENTAIIPYAGSDPKRPDRVFLQLVRNLTPGQSPVLRIGGDSTDWAWYPVPGLAKPNGVRVTLTRRWLAVMHTVASDLNARLIMGVDLEADSRAAADGEAAAFERGIGKHWIEALELGNEPNLYGTFTWYVQANGVHVMGRPPSYDFQSYLDDFSSFAKGLPGPLAGPATGAPSWMADTSAFLDAEPRVGIVTMHRYPVQTCFVSPSDPTYPTAAHLLAPAATTGLADGVAPYVPVAHAHHLPLRIDEMNTDSCGDAPGVSNAFVSALWALNALFEMAKVGVDGVNMHTYPGATYQLFTFSHAGGRWSAFVTPEYYGLLMFAQAAPAGSRLVSTTITNAEGVNAWATRGKDGRTRVLFINESLDRRTVAVPSVGGRTATLERLRAPALTSTSGVTLGGQSFGTKTTTGLLAGRSRIATLTASHGEYEFTLPAESAALITY
ncbi:MAG TPA: glycosyl hydrolase family 79 C-terminal domain-containing protein [Solirubrobacteraceae bacterium]|nr:glycosyl hydrolase family 79 C-terminal domain-containing protein [Solirubrobacteraceae bacterium]